MNLLHRIGDLAGASRSQSRTVRLRLTLLYGALFLICGAVALTATYLLVSHATSTGQTTIARADGSTVQVSFSGGIANNSAVSVPKPAFFESSPGLASPRFFSPDEVLYLASQQHTQMMRQLLLQSGVSLGIMAVVALWLGWIIAGRVLSPLRTITATTRNISASNLHERLALKGPRDELKELGDTIDGLLGRLEAAFQSQRQFVANASHELRTPLARQRALIQVALGDPNADEASLRAALERALVSGGQEEQLIEALLTLARSQSGLAGRESFDLALITDELLLAREREVDDRGLQLRADLSSATVEGDRRLMERMIANLLDNAIRYNQDGGELEVRTATDAGDAVISVVNSGQVISASEVERLLQPFHRFGSDRTNRGDGLGLGLSIVQAIATAHGGDLSLKPREGGGLEVEVRFPRAPSG